MNQRLPNGIAVLDIAGVLMARLPVEHLLLVFSTVVAVQCHCFECDALQDCRLLQDRHWSSAAGEQVIDSSKLLRSAPGTAWCIKCRTPLPSLTCMLPPKLTCAEQLE
jgi:hypothetical protein